MKKPARSFLSAAIRILFVLLCFSCKEKQTATLPTANTNIEWEQKNWNFGEIAQGETVVHTFRFINAGQENLLIKNIETGCGCTTVRYDKSPIPPGTKGKIEIAFNSEGRYGKQYKEIRIFANISAAQSILSFTANVKN